MSSETAEWLNTNTLIGFTDPKYGRGKAWHYRRGLQGDEPNHYPDAIPVEDVRRRLFGWEAVSSPLVYMAPAPEGEDVPDVVDAKGNALSYVTDTERQVIYRSDNHNVLGVFKEGYVPHQYGPTLLDAVAQLLTPDGLAATDEILAIGSAGLLRGGARAWVQVQRPDNVRTPEGVEFRPTLLSGTSFDGSLATVYKMVYEIVVCDNTMDAALAEKSGTVKVRHSRNSGLKIEDARQALQIIVESADTFAAYIKKLCETEVTDKQFEMFLNEWAKLPAEAGRAKSVAENKRSIARNLWNTDMRVAPWTNTAFGVLQTTNTYDHHFRQIKNTTDRAERNMDDVLGGKSAASDAETMKMLEKVFAASE